jgi:hypothetical protein
MQKNLFFLVYFFCCLVACKNIKDQNNIFYNDDKKSILIKLPDNSYSIFNDDCTIIHNEKIYYDKTNNQHFVDGYLHYCNREIQNFRNRAIEIKLQSNELSLFTSDTCIYRVFENYKGLNFKKLDFGVKWDSVIVFNSYNSNKTVIYPNSVNITQISDIYEYPFSVENLINIFLNSNVKIHSYSGEGGYKLKIQVFWKGKVIKETEGDKIGCFWRALSNI